MQSCLKCGVEKDISEFFVRRARVKNCVACRDAVIPSSQKIIFRRSTSAPRQVVEKRQRNSCIESSCETKTCKRPRRGCVASSSTIQPDKSHSNMPLVLELDLDLDFSNSDTESESSDDELTGDKDLLSSVIQTEDDSFTERMCCHEIRQVDCLACLMYKRFLLFNCIHSEYDNYTFLAICQKCKIVCYHGRESFEKCEICLFGNVCKHSKYRPNCTECQKDPIKCKHGNCCSTCAVCFKLRTHHRSFWPV